MGAVTPEAAAVEYQAAMERDQIISAALEWYQAYTGHGSHRAMFLAHERLARATRPLYER